MKQIVKLLLVGLTLSVLQAQEVKKGTLSVLLFSHGKPLVENEVKVDGKQVFLTDKDGAIRTKLSAGKHQVEIFGKDSSGANLGYFKKPVTIEEGKDTQVIATLSSTQADTIDIDTPVKSDASTETVMDKTTGEGTLIGRVLSSEGSKPIQGARVFVRGTSVDTRTDANGRFSAKVPSGVNLSISVVHSAYSAQTLGNIKVKKGGTTSRTIKLTPASMELEEFVVLAPKVEGSITDVIQEEKKTTSIANIIGAEQFAKKGDSSASSALKRVPGLTLVGNGNVYVRGLGERYSNIELNGMALPSPNPIKRVVPVDVFPSSAIGSIVIQKSPSADIPSNFGGGYINIRTRDVTDEDFIRISMGASAHDTVGKEGIDYEGSTTDWLGVDDGYRAINSQVLAATTSVEGKRPVTISLPEGFTREDIFNLTKKFYTRIYDIQNKPTSPGYNVGIEGQKVHHIDDENLLSAYLSYNYSSKQMYVKQKTHSYFMSLNGNIESQPDGIGENRISTHSYKQNLMFNLAYSFNDVLKLKYTKLYLLDSEKSTKQTQAIIGSDSADTLISRLGWDEKIINTDQLSGNMKFYMYGDHELDFGIENASASMNRPGDVEYWYYNIGQGYEYNTLVSTNAQIQKINSKDDVIAGYVKDKMKLNLFSENDYAEIGMSFQSKKRNASTLRYYASPIKDLGTSVYLSNIDTVLRNGIYNAANYDQLAFSLQTLYSPSDIYHATLDENYGFVNIALDPLEGMEVILGAKKAHMSQKLSFLTEDRADGRKLRFTNKEITLDKILPSFSVKYAFDEKDQVKFSYGQSYIYPDFREFTSGGYMDPNEIAQIVGNPDLTYTDITNFDLKYEHYFTDVNYITAAVFYKSLINPIEDASIPSSTIPVYTYINSKSANIYGIELDGTTNLGFLKGEHTSTIEKYLGDLNNYYLSANMTFLKSKVDLTEKQKAEYTTDGRQLQGLSPTVYNLTLGYDDPQKRSLTLNYNLMGQRIRKVGMIESVILGQKWPDLYEVPAPLLDFVWIEQFENGLKMEFKAENIINGDTVWTLGKNGLETNRFKTGRSYSIGVSYNF